MPLDQRLKNVPQLFLLATLIAFIGCFRDINEFGPLNARDMELLVTTAKHSPSVEFRNSEGKRRHITITEQQATQLVKTLQPLTDAKETVLGGDFEFELGFQAGRNPVQLQIRIVGDHLEFFERKYLYTGGDAKAFQSTMNEILSDEKTNETSKHPD